MKMMRNPNTGEYVLVQDDTGYEGWEVEADDVPPPGIDDVWSGEGWVFSQERHEERVAREVARNPNAMIGGIAERVTALEESAGAPAWLDVTDKPAAFPPTTHSHGIGDVEGLIEALAGKQAAGNYAAAGHTHSALDIVGLPSGGSDPWTYIKLASDFSISTTAAGDIPGMAFTPAANTQYEFEAMLLVRTAVTTTGPRPGVAWPSGLADGVVRVDAPSNAVARATANGTIAAEVVANSTGLPVINRSYPARIVGTVIAGAAPSGNVRLRLRSETAAVAVTVMAGSFLKWRVLP
jgi:hypothetical protein